MIYVSIHVESNALSWVWKIFQDQLRITKHLQNITKIFAAWSTSLLPSGQQPSTNISTSCTTTRSKLLPPSWLLNTLKQIFLDQPSNQVRTLASFLAARAPASLRWASGLLFQHGQTHWRRGAKGLGVLLKIGHWEMYGMEASESWVRKGSLCFLCPWPANAVTQDYTEATKTIESTILQPHCHSFVQVAVCIAL